MINNKLISHQVFESIQGGISDSPMRHGNILFANKYTGEPVEMSEELRLALNMNGTFIGNNPINQLEKAFAGVPGGPWVIDVRNDVLYIHNKAIDQPAVYDYVYGSENGELLKLSFKTQYITKNVPRGGTMSIDQFTKTLKMHSSSQTSAADIASDSTDTTAKRVLINRANKAYLQAKANTMYPTNNREGGTSYTRGNVPLSRFISYVNLRLQILGKKTLGNDVNNLYSMSLDNLTQWYDSYIEYLTKQTSTSFDQYTRSASDSDLRYLQGTKSNEYYQALPSNEFNALVADFLDKVLGEDRTTRYRQEVESELKRAFQQGPESVSEVLHRYFDGTTYSIYTHNGLNAISNVDVANLIKGDVKIPTPVGFGGGSVFFTKADGRFKQSGEQVNINTIAPAVRDFLKNYGYQEIYLTAYDVQTGPGSYSCKFKIKCRQPMRNYKTVSGFQFMYDYYTRYNGSPQSRYSQYLRSQALGANTSRKITEQRLEIEMVVVGRPSLTVNSKLKISNIGSRSGEYIIDRCIHQITPGEGYTCSLTLSQGGHNEPVGTVTTEVPLSSEPKKSGGGTASGGGTRTRPNGNGGVVNTTPTEPISIWVTPAERAYFTTLLTREDATSAQEEFITQIKYSRYKAYENARAQGKSDEEAREAVRRVNQTGIVSIKNKNVSSDNMFLKENLQPHYQQIPQRYRVAYRDEVRKILQENINGIKSRLG